MNWFDDILKELKRTIKDSELIFDRLLGTVSETETDIGEAPIHYGFSIHIENGKPVVTEYGNMNPIKNEQINGTVHTPYVETHIDKEAGTLIIVAELPGVSKENVKVKASKRKVTISAESEKKKYYKEIDTKHEIDPKSTEAEYKNGILEVRLKLKEPPESDEFEVEVK